MSKCWCINLYSRENFNWHVKEQPSENMALFKVSTLFSGSFVKKGREHLKMVTVISLMSLLLPTVVGSTYVSYFLFLSSTSILILMTCYVFGAALALSI